MDQQKQMATYTDPALPLHKDVLILIEKFVSNLELLYLCGHKLKRQYDFG